MCHLYFCSNRIRLAFTPDILEILRNSASLNSHKNHRNDMEQIIKTVIIYS